MSAQYPKYLKNLIVLLTITIVAFVVTLVLYERYSDDAEISSGLFQITGGVAVFLIIIIVLTRSYVSIGRTMSILLIISLTATGGYNLIYRPSNEIPQAEIDAAMAAIQEVKDAGIDLYLPDEYAALVDTFQKVNDRALASKKKLLPNYIEVKRLLTVTNQMIADVRIKLDQQKMKNKQYQKEKKEEAQSKQLKM